MSLTERVIGLGREEETGGECADGGGSSRPGSGINVDR
jgi:hypothetical protein